MRGTWWGPVFAVAAAFAGAGCGVESSVDSSDPSGGGGSGAVPLSTQYPILFVTQVPVTGDFTNIVSTFGNHQAHPVHCPRGGDLWIRYPDGELKNLTRAAGFGICCTQDERAIAVREPSVHWTGRKAVFSMLVGSPDAYQLPPNPWQLYEIEGFRKEDVPVIRRVPNQPLAVNNTSPCYASDGRILFTSDLPHNQQSHLYPQRDEYEEQPTNTGLWSLNPSTGELFLLEHAPSGAFSPSVDSFGRVVFVRWDHLERDQQADDDRINVYFNGASTFGTFNWSDESPSSVPTASNEEQFPDPRDHWVNFVNNHPGYRGDMNGWSPELIGTTINHFIPWQISQDGTGEETLGHVGRHELFNYFYAARRDDPNLHSFLGRMPWSRNQLPIRNFFQIREDPNRPGDYYGIDAPEFYSHASGQVIRLRAPLGMSPDAMTIEYVTARETADTTPNPTPAHSGHYRNPLPLSDGRLIASHTSETDVDTNVGSATSPKSRYDFRLKVLVPSGSTWVAGRPLTDGIRADIKWWDPSRLIGYQGDLWELDPVEVRPREVPPDVKAQIEAPELQVLAQENVSVDSLVAYLRSRDLALVVSRDVTTRDRNDQQQPFNLRVAGTSHVTASAPGTVYDLSHLQFFQADLLRGLTFGGAHMAAGRRVLGQAMHERAADNPPDASAPPGGVAIAPDGSAAALVPARRAMSWQTVDPTGHPVVRERYWITFQPGEIRTCTSCHGLSTADQLGRPPPTNPPQALGLLLQHLKSNGSL